MMRDYQPSRRKGSGMKRTTRGRGATQPPGSAGFPFQDLFWPAAAAIVIIACIVAGLQLRPQQRPTTATGEIAPPSAGPANAAVTVTIFSDFECPFCRVFAQDTLNLLRASYGDRVRFEFRQNPIAAVHPHARAAAEASACAATAGDFWRYHDWLFHAAGHRTLDEPTLIEGAVATNLDIELFTGCREQGVGKQRVDADRALSRERGVNATPTVFINDLRVVGMQPTIVYQKMIDLALAGGQPATVPGTP